MFLNLLEMSSGGVGGSLGHGARECRAPVGQDSEAVSVRVRDPLWHKGSRVGNGA